MTEAKTVAIVGAGPVGLAAAAHVLTENCRGASRAPAADCRPTRRRTKLPA